MLLSTEVLGATVAAGVAATGAGACCAARLLLDIAWPSRTPVSRSPLPELRVS